MFLPELDYIRCFLNSTSGERKFLPITAGQTKAFSIFIEGVSPFTKNIDTQPMQEALSIIASTLKGIYETYECKFYFHEPSVHVSTVGVWTLKIRMFEKEIWDEIQNKKEE